jgi:hypothetical protein
MYTVTVYELYKKVAYFGLDLDTDPLGLKRQAQDPHIECGSETLTTIKQKRKEYKRNVTKKSIKMKRVNTTNRNMRYV